MMKVALKLLMVVILLPWLSACGGEVGDGVVATQDPETSTDENIPATTLTGSVTDTNLAPVAGATVLLLETGFSTTTDAAGRYSITGEPASSQYSLKFSGPDPSYFPAFGRATLVENNPTVLDVYLVRSGNNPVSTIDAATGGTVVSSAYIGGSLTTTLTLNGDELESSDGTLYGGTASVYLAPIDIGNLGFGLATYQTGLSSVFADLTTSSSMVELFGAAAVTTYDDLGNKLDLAATSAAVLEIPIPASPAELRTYAPGTASLWFLDEETGVWSAIGTATAGDTYYDASITRMGYWRVGVAHDSTDLTEITGRILFNDSTPAAGATVYVKGVDYGHQDQTTTDADGNYSSPALAVGEVTVYCAVSANGAQWVYEQNFVNPTTANLTLPFAPPVAGAAAEQTITVDSRDSVAGFAPDVIGYILSSGRLIHEADSTDDSTPRNVANVIFVANSLADCGPICLEPSLDGGGIQVVAEQTFGSLTTAPSSGYNTANSQNYQIDLSTAALPLLVAVKTARNQYGKISIDEVTPLDTDNNEWQITFRHAFSLTGDF